MSCFKLDVLLICALCIPGVVTKYTPYLNPVRVILISLGCSLIPSKGFFFDYNKQNQSVPIPITREGGIFSLKLSQLKKQSVEQCERIHISWGRRTARGYVH